MLCLNEHFLIYVTHVAVHLYAYIHRNFKIKCRLAHAHMFVYQHALQIQKMLSAIYFKNLFFSCMHSYVCLKLTCMKNKFQIILQK